MEFYTYLWLREDGTPYYVGKGCGGRAFRKGAAAADRVLVETHASEEDAFEAEKFLIAFYGRKDNRTGILRNLTDGGEGVSNPPATVIEKRALAISRALQGKQCGADNGFFGKHHSLETRARWSETRRERGTPLCTQTPEAKRKRTATLKRIGAGAQFRTLVALENQRVAMKKRRGYKHTAASIELMRQKAAAMWARRRRA